MNRFLPSDFNMRLRHSSNVRYRKRNKIRAYIRYIFYIAMAAGLSAGGYLIYTQAAGFIESSNLFVLKEVQIKGYEHVLPAEIIRASGLSMGENIFSIPLRTVKNNIMSIPWINNVSIRKSPPHRIDITVAERKIYCMILLNHLYYVDHNGVIFKKVTDNDSFNYPVITGFHMKNGGFIDAALPSVINAVAFLKELDHNSIVINNDISELHVSNKGYTVITNNGLLIKFGRKDFVSRIDKLNTLIKYFGDKMQMFFSIDLRFANMAVFRYKPGFRNTSGKILKSITQKEVNNIGKRA